MKYYLTILFFGLLIFHSYGESKPKVELIFKIDDPLYKMQYGNELSSLESKIQQGLCVIFNKQLSFIDFTPEESDDRFIISLHNIFKNSTDISTPKDLVFFFDFNGPNVKTDIPPLHWNFQNKSKYGEVAFSSQDFSSRIISEIDFNLNSKYEMMVESIFSKFILTKEGHMMLGPNYQGWVLPFSSEDLGIGNETKFKIEVEKDTDIGSAICDYVAKVFILKIKPNANVPEKFKGCFFVNNTSENDDCSIFSTDDSTTIIKEVTIEIFDRGEQLVAEIVPPENFVPNSN